MKNFTEKKKRGLLIVFEGVDRAGKSTQLQMLKNYFEEKKNEKCNDLRFPDRETKIGKEINEILKNHKSFEIRATHLLFSLNRWEKKEEIINYLESGVNLLIDRYAFSGVVYSICSGAKPEWCMHPDQGLPRPDLVLQLDLNIDTVKNRENFGDEIYEKEEFQTKVRKEYKRFENYRYWRIINADQEKEKVNQDIISELEKLIKEYESNSTDDFCRNFYPTSIGDDLFMYKDI